jgi:thioredoxin-like negative regulator of GroEL
MVRSPLFLDTTQVRFASVDYGTNRKLCQSLNIQQLPTVQFYYGEESLTSFPCPPKEFKQLPRMLMKYLDRDHAQLEQVVQEWEQTSASSTREQEYSATRLHV